MSFVGFWKDGLLALIQAKMSRSCRFLLFLHHNYQVSLICCTDMSTNFICYPSWSPIPCHVSVHMYIDVVPALCAWYLWWCCHPSLTWTDVIVHCMDAPLLLSWMCNEQNNIQSLEIAMFLLTCAFMSYLVWSCLSGLDRAYFPNWRKFNTYSSLPRVSIFPCSQHAKTKLTFSSRASWGW